MPLTIDWESVYDGTVRPVTPGTDMWGDKSGAFDLAFALSNQKMNKKFDVPIKPIPWSPDFVENVSYTLEWVLRDHRKEEFRHDSSAFVEHIREFWYRSAHFEGEYTHVCYPREMLTYRSQYDAAYAQLASLPPSAMSSHCLGYRECCKNMLWTTWKCFGIDGIFDRVNGTNTYRYSCNRCGTDMPKAVKAFVKLQLLQKKVGDVSS